MITVYNENMSEDMQQKYRNLMNRAYNDLQANNLLSDTDGEMFTDLAQYYAHMKDYLSIQKPVYLLLPVDEGHFVIDANSRQIRVPDEFNQCGGVTNDNLCEIATFTINRYFDYVDLASPTVKIRVEWKNAAGEEGYTNISLIDLDTFFADGKIRFGWPITKDITKQEGVITFAVKFFMETPTGEMTHVLHTLPATLVVKKGLQIDYSQDLPHVDANAALFENIVSNNIGNVANLPSRVEVADYNWKDSTTTPKSKAIDPDSDTLILASRFHTADFNQLTYSWYRKSWDAAPEDEATPIDLNSEYYTIKTDYELYPKTENEKFPFIKFYQKQSENQYVPYTGINWPEDNSDLYVEKATLTFNPIKTGRFDEDNNEILLDKNYDITGTYYAYAENKKQKLVPKKDENGNVEKDENGNVIMIKEDVANLPPMSSKTEVCALFRPDEFSYTSDLSQYKVLPAKESISLTVNFEESDKQPTLTHLWAGVDDKNAKITISNDNITNTSTSTSCKITTPGFYSVTTTSELNRFKKTVKSSSCKVVNPIESPDIGVCYCAFDPLLSIKKEQELKAYIDSMEDIYKLEYEPEEGEPSAIKTILKWDDSDDEPYIIPDTIDYNEVFVLKVTHSLLDEVAKGNLSLKTDGVSYQWEYRKADEQNWTQITEALRGEGNLIPKSCTDLTTNAIAINCIWKEEQAYAFRCIVTNTLADEESSKTSQQIIIYNKKDSV